jgi:hypothetical protein
MRSHGGLRPVPIPNCQIGLHPDHSDKKEKPHVAKVTQKVISELGTI